jgi:hypothetical protein
VKIPITNKGDPNAADCVSFGRLNDDHLMMTLNTYESFALLSREEAAFVGNALLLYSQTGRLTGLNKKEKPNG